MFRNKIYKIEEKKFDKVDNTVRILIKEQKVQSTKIAEIENKLDMNEKYISKLEKGLKRGRSGKSTYLL